MAAAYRYIGAGVKTDCKVLIEKFIQKKSVRFQDFIEIWREMQFPCIYSGRPTFAELYEFIEEVLHIAKEFFLAPNNLQTKICGLYLLYGLYYMQPTIEDRQYLVKIRITLSEWKESESFMDTLREQKHYDALYIFYKMFVENAFYFCAMPREYGIEKSIRKHLEREDAAEESGPPKSDVLRLEESGLLNSLEEVSKKYYSAKCSLDKGSDDTSDTPNKLLSYVSPNIAANLRKIMKPLYQGDEQKDEDFDIGAHRKKLRQKASAFKRADPTTFNPAEPSTSSGKTSK